MDSAVKSILSGRFWRASSAKRRTAFDKLVLVVAIAEPLSTLPQVYQVWVKHQIAGVSATTWLLYSLSEVIWLIYGVRRKDFQLFIGSLVWAAMELSVAIGVLVK